MPSGQVDGGRRADAGEAADRKNPKIVKTHKQRTKDLNGDLSTFPKHCGMLKISWTQEPPGPGYEATSRGRRPNHLWFLWYFSRNTFLHTQASSSRTTPLKTVPLYFGTWWKQVCLVGSLVWTEKVLDLSRDQSYICEAMGRGFSLLSCISYFETSQPSSPCWHCGHETLRPAGPAATGHQILCLMPCQSPSSVSLTPKRSHSQLCDLLVTWPVRPYSRPTQILRPQLASRPSI